MEKSNEALIVARRSGLELSRLTSFAPSTDTRALAAESQVWLRLAGEQEVATFPPSATEQAQPAAQHQQKVTMTARTRLPQSAASPSELASPRLSSSRTAADRLGIRT
jgi:hypothetical protein